MPKFCSFEEFDRLTNEIVGPALAPFGFRQASVKKDRGYHIKNYTAGDQTIRVYFEWTGYLDTSYRSEHCVGATPQLLLKMLGRPRPDPLESDPTAAEALQRECAMLTEDLADVLNGDVDYRITKNDLNELLDKWKSLAQRLSSDLARSLAVKGYVPAPSKSDECKLERKVDFGTITFKLDYAFRYLGLEATPHIYVAVDAVETFLRSHFVPGNPPGTWVNTLGAWMYEAEGKGMKSFWISDESEYETKRDHILAEYERIGEPFGLGFGNRSVLYDFLKNYRIGGGTKDRDRPDWQEVRAIYVACLLGKFTEARAAITNMDQLLAAQPETGTAAKHWKNWRLNWARVRAALETHFTLDQTA